MIYYRLVKAALVNSFRLDTAFIFNNWANLLSTTVYTITWIQFFNIVFLNTPNLAGYNRDETIFFVFIAQVTFYILTGLLLRNIAHLIADVNTGHFDLLLLKPTPSLFHTLVRELNVFAIVRDATIPFTFIILAIDFSNLSIGLLNLIVGIFIMFVGCIISYLVSLWSALPVFWIGESKGIYELNNFITYDLADDIPYEGFERLKALQVVLTYILPALISTGLSTSVMLGKSSWQQGLTITIIVGIIVVLITKFLWQLALRNYGSASS